MLFIQARGTVGFIFNEINKWIFMQFSVMNLNGFDFNIVSIYSRVPALCILQYIFKLECVHEN
jgi:hypothetical protein